MATNKHPEETGRDGKVQEILSILGELYQRVGYQHAAPANVRLTGPDYRFMGYRPYSMDAVQRPPADYVPMGPGPVPLRAFFPGQPETVNTLRVPGF